MKKLLGFLFLMLLIISNCASSQTSQIQLKPKSLDFQTTFVGQTSQLTVSVKNSTGDVQKITDVLIVGPDCAEFFITTGWTGTEINLAALSTVDFTIDFTPTCAGDKIATLEVHHDNVSTKTPLQSAIRAKSVVNATLVMLPDNHNFGFVPLLTQRTADFTLENIGSVALEITQLEFIGACKCDFSITVGWTGIPLNIGPGEKKQITVTFEPLSDGNKTIRLKATHSGTNSPHEITLNGGGGYGFFEETFPKGITSIRHSGRAVLISNYEDDECYELQLGFNFSYFGHNYSNVWVCDNGWVSFGSGSYTDPDAYDNTVIPNSNRPNNVVYPFWDDFEFNTSTIGDAKWIYEVSGNAPNRVFTVEWYKFNRYNASPVAFTTFQVKLYETSNVIEFLYSNSPSEWTAGNTWSATIGLENENGSKAYQKNGSPNISSRPTTNYRFIP